jgi:hypothetical protein
MGIAEAICQRRTSLTSDVDFTSVVERQRTTQIDRGQIRLLRIGQRSAKGTRRVGE